ncbi:ABC transporter permease [Brevibacterium sp. CS2]|uniref:ABC transporter permease n=1 Tax=Brevibacterium sp. CS2 TaxID=2575923 RepID=UPI0010C7793B|nr:ABC transporter permease [Brevibacterium sp. CS2]QCP06112.1 molybdate ABC transporter permease subunit [Brevibacterium sp. CS2]
MTPVTRSGIRLPAWLAVPAVLGAGLVGLPLIGLLSCVDLGGLAALLGSPASREALRLSLLTSLAATVLCVLLGVPLALVLARAAFPGRRIVRTVVLLPIVLPPVVGGIALLSTFGRMGLLGAALEAGGMRIAYTWVAVVLAQTFVSLPFMVLTLEGALRSHDSRYEEVAAGLGASPGYTLRRVTLPLLTPALVSGTVLCWARALGEFGATITFAGSLQGSTRTVPLEVYLLRETDPDGAVALSLVLVLVAAVVVGLLYRPGRQA